MLPPFRKLTSALKLRKSEERAGPLLRRLLLLVLLLLTKDDVP